MRLKISLVVAACAFAVAASAASAAVKTNTATKTAKAACITGTVNRVTVESGQTVCITTGAQVGAVVVNQNGSLDIEGGSIGTLGSNGAASIKLCGASFADTNVTIKNSLGPVNIGGAGCASSTFAGSVTLDGNRVGVTLTGATVHDSVKVTNTLGVATVTNNTVTNDATIKLNTQGIVVTGNTVGGTLTVQINYGPPLIDSPNTAGVSNVQ